MVDKEFRKILCNRIIALRKKYKLKQEQLALQSGIAKGGLSEIERCKKTPSTYTIAKICSGLGITIDEFFAFDEIRNYMDKL